MKTPEQVAMSLYTSGKFHSPIVADGDLMRDVMVAAIEADRAQRKEIASDWRDDQESVRDADHVSVSWTAHDSRGRNIFQSDIVITAEQAVGMFQGIGEAQ